MIDFQSNNNCDCDKCFDKANFEITEIVESENLQKTSPFYEDEVWKIVQEHPFHAKEWMQEQVLINCK